MDGICRTLWSPRICLICVISFCFLVIVNKIIPPGASQVTNSPLVKCVVKLIYTGNVILTITTCYLLSTFLLLPRYFLFLFKSLVCFCIWSCWKSIRHRARTSDFNFNVAFERLIAMFTLKN